MKRCIVEHLTFAR